MNETEEWQRERVKTLIVEALDGLYAADGVLLKTGRKGVGERAIVFHLARRLVGQFGTLDVDVEYDKHGEGSQAIPKRSQGALVVPDLIVHRRGTPSHNLLAVEAKLGAKHGLAEQVADVVKLCHLVTDHEYTYGIFILLGAERDACRMSWIERRDGVLFHELDSDVEGYRDGELFRAPLAGSNRISGEQS